MRRRILVAAACVAVLAGVALAVVDPFGGGAAPRASGFDNGAPTATAKIERQSLSSQTSVSGTLGYAGSWTIAVPAGTSTANLRQAQQAVASARAQLAAAQATAAADAQALARAQATLAADRLKQTSDCAGTSAAAGTSTPCGASVQAVAGAEAALTSAQQKLSSDRAQVAGDRLTLAGGLQALADAQASAASYGSSASYTMLPAAGKVVGRGEPLYAIDGQPTLLLYGSTPAWRSFGPGMSPGADVAELNANLRALGLGDLSGDAFTSATARAVAALQSRRGLAPTGTLLLGAVAFEPGAVRVTSATPTVGQAVQPGAVLTVSSTRHQVVVELDAAQQSSVMAGDKVTVTLPDESVRPGVVSSVGKVATTPSGDSGNSGGPTVEVDIRLLDAAVGDLDQAPVQVSITTETVNDVLVVPVNALVALAGGGYALELVEPDGTHRLAAVSIGLFDDSSGLVQVAGSGLSVGQRVVVPASS